MHVPKMDIAFWRRQKREGNPSIYVVLYARITISGKQLDVGSTGIKILPEHWDGKEVTSDDSEAYFKNETLDIVRNHLRAAFNDVFRDRQEITARKIKAAYLARLAPTKAVNSMTLLGLFDLYLHDCANDKQRGLTASTLVVYDNVRKKVTAFLHHESSAGLLATEFDIDWIKRYQQWMARVSVVDGTKKKTGHSSSYISKQSHTIKNVLIWGRLHKKIAVNPLEGIRIKAGVFDDPVYLTDEQFDKLRNHDFKNSLLQETADVFIILCRSGFHYGDLLDLVKKNDDAVRMGLDGQQWIMKDRIKTEIAIRVPIFNEVQAIINKYKGWENLPVRPSQTFNNLLKLVAAQLDLPADLSSKAGRKTFTDWCFNTRRFTTESILVMLGRTSSKGLEVYGRPGERRVIAELKEQLDKERNKNSESESANLKQAG